MRAIEREPIAGELNAFWNAVAAGKIELPPVSDASLADLMLAIHRSDQIEHAPAEFRHRLLSQMASPSGAADPQDTGTVRVSASQRRRVDVEQSRRRYLWLAAMLALLLAGVGGFRIWAAEHREESLAWIPAVTEPALATPMPAYHETPLLDLTVDPAVLGLDPQVEWGATFFEIGYVEPGKSFVLCQNDYCSKGLAVFMVMDGTVTVSFDAPVILVTTAGERMLDAGTEATLQPGESVAFDSLSLVSAQAGDAKRLDLLIHFTGARTDAMVGSFSTGHIPQNLWSSAAASDLSLNHPITGPVRLTIDRIDADRSTLVPVQPLAGETLMIVGVQSTFGLTSEGDGPLEPTRTLWEASFDDMSRSTYVVGNPSGPLDIIVARMSPA